MNNKITKSERRDSVIDESLRRVFRDLDDEPIPDRFTDLLKQLRDKEAKRDPDE